MYGSTNNMGLFLIPSTTRFRMALWSEARLEGNCADKSSRKGRFFKQKDSLIPSMYAVLWDPNLPGMFSYTDYIFINFWSCPLAAQACRVHVGWFTWRFDFFNSNLSPIYGIFRTCKAFTLLFAPLQSSFTNACRVSESFLQFSSKLAIKPQTVTENSNGFIASRNSRKKRLERKLHKTSACVGIPQTEGRDKKKVNML